MAKNIQTKTLVNRAWHQQILENRFMDWKQSKRVTAFQSDCLKQPSLLPYPLDSYLFQKDSQPHLKLAFQGLDPKQKAALILHYYQKHSLEQVAEILGMSLHALHSMFEIMRQKIKLELTKLMKYPYKK